MEVFVHNLPAQGNLSSQGLLLQLRPFMRDLKISDTAYDCEKAATKRHAFITFLSEDDGKRFLGSHGEVPLISSVSHGKGPPRGTASRLKILGAHVMCRKSNRPPSRASLGVLAAKENERLGTQKQGTPHTGNKTNSVVTGTAPTGKQTMQPTFASASANDKSFMYERFSCGYYKYINGGELVFVPEYVQVVQKGLAEFGKRHLTITSDDRRVIYVPLSTIQEIVWSPQGLITLTLSTVPLFFSAPDDAGKRWRLTGLDDRHAKIVGKCLVYHIVVRPEQIHRKMQRLANLGGLTVTRHDVHYAAGPDFSTSDANLRTLLSQFTTTKRLPFSLLLQLQALASNAYLHPDTVNKLARKLASSHDTAPISAEAMKKLFQAIDWPTPNHHDPSEFEVPALYDYLVETEQGMEKGLYVREGLVNPGRNLTAIHRVMVTPTHQTLHGPELENKNRVLRKFPNHHDYFIRVQFCDEDGQSLRFNGRVDFTHVYDRFRRAMVDGISVAGRTYIFLGWSHSSLRSHSMWFVAPFIDDNGQLQTHFTIISALGNFDTIYSPARCAARIGQAFSETPFAVPMAENNISVYEIPDIVSSTDASRVFSDGVGTISWKAAEAIWKQLPRGKKKPTCFQIRFAGAKGMLALDSRLTDNSICLRPSMIKFKSTEMANLEICDMATQPIPLYLNRQLIKILEDMGVPTSWFQKLQDDALRELKLITSSPYNMASFLKVQAVATAIKLHKLLLLADRLGLDFRTDPFLRRATDAVILRELRLLKHKARLFVPLGITLFGIIDETNYLRENEVYITFDVPKNGSKSRRFRAPPGNGNPVIVTRSPALHPGDIQRATNVHPPAADATHPLHYLRNCIVFSSKGVRDLPSQLSGGDLDGDIFNIIWDPVVCDLPGLKTFVPADYPRQDPVNIGRRVTTADIADFFLDFVRTDHLGTIATRHMILADQLPEGTRETNCIQLAALHSTAVDFSKTGIPADLKNMPRASRYRPDFLSPGPIVEVHSRKDIDLEQFMAKNVDGDDADDDETHELDAPTYKYYQSTKTLGTLYRAIDERRIWQDDVRYTISNGNGDGDADEEPMFYDAFLEWATHECELLGGTNWQQRTDEALRIRSAYEDSILTTMYEFSEHPTLPITELEVFIGTIVNKTGSQTLRQRDRSRKLRDEYERISSWITAQIRPHGRTNEGDGGVDGENDGDDGEEDDFDKEGRDWRSQRLAVLELCLACTYSQKDDKKDEKDDRRTERNGLGHATENKNNNRVESFWLVAASALIRELEFIHRGLRFDADLRQDMAQLSLGGGRK
ncbi:RNA-dependent RNA polymerase [Sporothrix brasiliensis 5110]|uniref:RNA-dependent RNA polymerase n=1 Tax=Sporothrix brasiliensis 5110 TaxID=1398154 RepID=A0A0C2J852_9PEZI|nr:RNA-dependent RNA polymerase [Sporothrix brasiliensis 5110]KIH95165.1 RNA-dependent RNA polymerase [Sporothrix brasiliensis 5110]